MDNIVLAAAEGETHSPVLPVLSEIILALIVFAILYVLMRKFVVPSFEKTFAERTQAIEGGLSAAETKQAEADAKLAELLLELGDARHEAARIREEARGLVPGVGELLLQFGELGVGLGLLGLGRGQAALDRLRALGEGLLEARSHELPDEEQQQAEDDQRQCGLDGHEAERVLRGVAALGGLGSLREEDQILHGSPSSVVQAGRVRGRTRARYR